MNDQTIAAPADQSQSVVDLDQLRAAARFGVTSFEAYVAEVLAESNHLFAARSSL